MAPLRQRMLQHKGIRELAPSPRTPSSGHKSGNATGRGKRGGVAGREAHALQQAQLLVVNWGFCRSARPAARCCSTEWRDHESLPSSRGTLPKVKLSITSDSTLNLDFADWPVPPETRDDHCIVDRFTHQRHIVVTGN